MTTFKTLRRMIGVTTGPFLEGDRRRETRCTDREVKVMGRRGRVEDAAMRTRGGRRSLRNASASSSQKKQSLARDSGGNVALLMPLFWPRDTDFGLLASRMAKEEISTILSHQRCGY